MTLRWWIDNRFYTRNKTINRATNPRIVIPTCFSNRENPNRYRASFVPQLETINTMRLHVIYFACCSINAIFSLQYFSFLFLFSYLFRYFFNPCHRDGISALLTIRVLSLEMGFSIFRRLLTYLYLCTYVESWLESFVFRTYIHVEAAEPAIRI